MLKQRTLKQIARTVGIGLHSGTKVELVLRPPAAETGIVFRRVDLEPPVEIKLTPEAVVDTRMATTMMNKLMRISFKLLDLLVILMMVFRPATPVLADPSPTGATITTQLPDYPPGAIVLMTGAGWAPDESVHIGVNADDLSWTLESNPDPVADGAGGFTYEFQLPAWYVPSYTVSATGFTSGTATVSFTDLNIGTYDQCSNDDGDGYGGDPGK